MFTFKSYSWVIGTTSFRVKEVNYRIEEQLKSLKELFAEHPGETWENNNKLQEAYYNKLQAKGLIVGDAPNKSKDGRQKTSVLKELGLVTKERQITEVGNKIIELINQGNIHATNDFMIDNVALVYLKQFLKVYVRIEDFEIKPFVSLVYMIDKLEYLSQEEFTYLLPLCKNQEDVIQMVEYIKQYRNGTLKLNTILLKYMLRMDNYNEALDYFLSLNTVTVRDICEIGLNRKSRDLDKPYYNLYSQLWHTVSNKAFTEADLDQLMNEIKGMKGKASTRWKKLLFGTSSSKGQQYKFFRENIIKNPLNTTDEKAFRKAFFQCLHLIKWKVNLEEYADLNERFFKLSDVVVFQDDKVELVLFAKYFFTLCIDELLAEPINQSILEKDISFEEISPALKVDTEDVINLINEKTGKKLTLNNIRGHLQSEKEKQFDKLVREKFSEKTLIKLLDLIEERADEKVQKYVTDNADVPTIYEYLLGISWYIISDYKINILDSLNMSLDANLLPKRHASGGMGDIVIEYPATQAYKEHKLLIEATLTSKTNQRRAEMEPVSRHLGNLKGQNPDQEVYCIFVANHLDTNVIVDLRSRKDIPFYDSTTSSWIRDNKILPLTTGHIKYILQQKLKYLEVYSVLEKAYRSDIDVMIWHEETIDKYLLS